MDFREDWEEGDASSSFLDDTDTDGISLGEINDLDAFFSGDKIVIRVSVLDEERSVVGDCCDVSLADFFFDDGAFDVILGGGGAFDPFVFSFLGGFNDFVGDFTLLIFSFFGDFGDLSFGGGGNFRLVISLGDDADNSVAERDFRLVVLIGEETSFVDPTGVAFVRLE
jgi:hypothetical protein